MTSPLLDDLLLEAQDLLQALGDTEPVPQPNTLEWLPFMRRVQQLDPVLAAKLAAAVRQINAPPPKRGLDQGAKLRGARRNVVRRLLFREETASDGSSRFVLDKRRAPVFGAVLVLGALGGYTLLWTLPSQQGKGLVEATMPEAKDEKKTGRDAALEAALPQAPERPTTSAPRQTKGKAEPNEGEETARRTSPSASTSSKPATPAASDVIASPGSPRAIDVPPPPVAFSTLSPSVEAPPRVVVPPRPAPAPRALVVEAPVPLDAPVTPPSAPPTGQTPRAGATPPTTAPRVVAAPDLAASSPAIRVPRVSSARSNPSSAEVLVEAPFGGTADVELPGAVTPPAPVTTFGGSPAESGEADVFQGGALVYARPAEAARPSGGAEPSEASAFGGGSALVYARPAEAARPSGTEDAAASGDDAEAVPASFTKSTSGLVYQKSASETPSSPANPFGGVPAPEAPPAPPFQPTQQVPATLVTGIEAVAGSSFPVVAHGGGGEWIGSASINATLSRVDVAFTKFVQGGKVFDVNALAYDQGLTQGLAASMRDVAPALASDLLRSGLGGLNIYAQSLAGGGTTLVQGGTALVQGNAVPLGTALLGELGKVFKVPEGQPSFVRVAKIERGAPLVILVGVK